MAHSAAYLSYVYHAPTQIRIDLAYALTCKAEAVRSFYELLSDPQKTLSYNTFAAVIRFLTFEVDKFALIQLGYSCAADY